MADCSKKDCCSGGKTMGTFFKVLVGLVFLVGALYVMLVRGWWVYTWDVVKGCTGPLMVLAGVITFAIAKE